MVQSYGPIMTHYVQWVRPEISILSDLCVCVCVLLFSQSSPHCLPSQLPPTILTYLWSIYRRKRENSV